GVAFFPNKSGDAERSQMGIIEGIKLAETLGAPNVNTYMGGNPERDMMTTIQLYQRTMEPCFEAAAARNITVLLENHFDNRNEDPTGEDVARRPETLQYLFEVIDAPNFKLTYDPCNFYIAGEEAYPAAYQHLQPHIGYVHVKDATRYSELLHGAADQYKLLPDSINGRYLPVSLAEGAVNFEGILHKLSQDGYQGYLTVEPHTEVARVERVGFENVEYLRDHLG
ncbi:MAG: sugar phosphate isomerase/epimerase family protein, partial [Chloroflexota bacterium]